MTKLTCKFFEHRLYPGEKIIEWPPSSPDLNLIKNPWSIVKMKLYEDVEQYNSKVNLRKAIETTVSETACSS